MLGASFQIRSTDHRHKGTGTQTATPVSTRFKAADIEEILDTLVLMGRVRDEGDGCAVK